jgi:hypothetical protein
VFVNPTYIGSIAANSATYLNGKTEANLNVNNAVYVKANTGIVSNTSGVFVNSYYIATIAANSAAYLGTDPAANFVQNTDSRTLSGNLVFSGANSAFVGNTTVGNLIVAANGDLWFTDGAGIQANGSFGTAGQVLSSDGVGNVYWASVTSSGSGFTNGQSISVNLLSVNSIAANGAANTGSSGQVLTSNGTGVYWGPQANVSSNITRTLIVANGSVNTFTIPGGYTANNIDIYLNGVKLQTNVEANVQSGSTITILGDTPANGTVIEAIGFVATPTVDYTKYIKTFSITGSFAAPITGSGRWVPISNTVINNIRLTNASNIVGADLIVQIYKNGSLVNGYALQAGNYTQAYTGMGITVTTSDYVTVNVYQGIGNNFNITFTN